MLARALRRTGQRANAAPAQIDPNAYAAATSEKLPAPSPSVERTSSGTPTIHVPDESVTASPSTTTDAARTGSGRSAAKPSEILGRSASGPPTRPFVRTPSRKTADRKNDAALRAKNALIGITTSRSPASAQPPTESASAVARTSPFACCTLRRSTSSGRSPPYAGSK